MCGCHRTSPCCRSNSRHERCHHDRPHRLAPKVSRPGFWQSPWPCRHSQFKGQPQHRQDGAADAQAAPFPHLNASSDSNGTPRLRSMHWRMYSYSSPTARLTRSTNGDELESISIHVDTCHQAGDATTAWRWARAGPLLGPNAERAWHNPHAVCAVPRPEAVCLGFAPCSSRSATLARAARPASGRALSVRGGTARSRR